MTPKRYFEINWPLIRQNIAGWCQQTFVFKCLLTTLSNVLPLHLKQTFPAIIWIFTEGEGDGIKSRLIWLWQKEICKLDLIWKWISNTEICKFWFLKPVFIKWLLCAFYWTRYKSPSVSICFSQFFPNFFFLLSRSHSWGFVQVNWVQKSLQLDTLQSENDWKSSPLRPWSYWSLELSY